MAILGALAVTAFIVFNVVISVVALRSTYKDRGRISASPAVFKPCQWRAGAAELALQTCLDGIGKPLAVHAAGGLGVGSLHDATHELHGGRLALLGLDLSDGLVNEGRDLIVRELCGLVSLEEGDIDKLGLSEFWAAVLGVDLCGLAAFLNLAGDDLKYVLVGEIVAGTIRFLGLDGGEQRADGARALLFTGLHGGLQVGADGFFQLTHAIQSTRLGTPGRVKAVKNSAIAGTLTAAAAATVAAGLGTLALAYRETSRFELKDITVPLLPKGTLRDAREFKLLHISDLHMIPGQERKVAWVSALDALDPDLVINTGDNLSDERAVPDVLRALGPLLARPGLFCFGTNDYWAPRLPNPFNYLIGKKNTPSYVDLPWQGMRAAFIEHGWRDANQARHEFKVGDVRLAAAGVDDPHHDLDDYAEIAGAPNEDADLALALLHAPEPRVLERFAADGYQLSLSGHTHGGQLCLPGSHAIVTNCGIDRARVQGLHDFGPMKMHVSNGLGQSKFVPFRVFCRPSATLIRITEVD